MVTSSLARIWKMLMLSFESEMFWKKLQEHSVTWELFIAQLLFKSNSVVVFDSILFLFSSDSDRNTVSAIYFLFGIQELEAAFLHAGNIRGVYSQ